MKKGIISLIVLFIGFAAVVTSYFMVSTYAKFTDTFNGTSTARVAKWDIKVNDLTSANNSDDATFTFNLFDSHTTYKYDPNVYANCLISNPNNLSVCVTYNKGAAIGENGAVVGGKIAPGTAGEYKFTIENKSDVAFRIANVLVTGTDATKLPGASSRIYFCLDGDKSFNSADTPVCAKGIDGLQTLFNRALVTTNRLDRFFGFSARKDSGAVHSISWYWEPSEDNTADTAVGKIAAQDPNAAIVNLKIKLILDQVAAQ